MTFFMAGSFEKASGFIYSRKFPCLCFYSCLYAEILRFHVGKMGKNVWGSCCLSLDGFNWVLFAHKFAAASSEIFIFVASIRVGWFFWSSCKFCFGQVSSCGSVYLSLHHITNWLLNSFYIKFMFPDRHAASFFFFFSSLLQFFTPVAAAFLTLSGSHQNLSSCLGCFWF